MRTDRNFQFIASIVAGFAVGMTMTLTSVFPKQRVKISRKKLIMRVGETAIIKRTGSSEKISWKISNKKVITVSAEGEITAKAEGKAGVMAELDGRKYLWLVVVRKKEAPDCDDFTVEIQERKKDAEAKTAGAEKRQRVPDYNMHGVVFDEAAQGWKYQGKRVAVLYDQKGYIFSDDSIPEEEAVYLEVIRGADGRVESLKKLSKEEAFSFSFF